MEGNEWKISGIAEANNLSKENKNTLKILLEEFKKKLTKTNWGFAIIVMRFQLKISE